VPHLEHCGCVGAVFRDSSDILHSLLFALVEHPEIVRAALPADEKTPTLSSRGFWNRAACHDGYLPGKYRPGEKEPGTFHYNPENMSGKTIGPVNKTLN
jgi:hypothetical protein